MNGQIDWGELFFSAAGRAPRLPSWVAAVILLTIAALYEAIPSVLHWITGWFVYPGLFYCGACVLSKRLHDRGRSGWWAALVLLVPDNFFDGFFVLVALWALIDLGAMPGEHGANRYGPNPLRPAALA